LTAAHVELVVPSLAVLDAAVAGDQQLGRELGYAVAEDWNGFSVALQRTRDAVAADPDRIAWGTRLFVVPEPRTLVGWGGFKGPPREGVVEIGYEIAPQWRGRGLATAAGDARGREAIAEASVAAVIAHTLPERNGSVRVLEKLGFERDGEIVDEQVGTAWRHRRRR
jgi:ribosomal-protein-alanine N-acetyltransferase